VEGRQYPSMCITRSMPVADYVIAAFDAVHVDSLARSRRATCSSFSRASRRSTSSSRMLLEQAGTQLLPLPLHAQLAYADQQRVFAPAPRGVRKVVVATNVAEASITIDGIVYVVDSGFVKLRTFDPAQRLRGAGGDARVAGVGAAARRPRRPRAAGQVLSTVHRGGV
jgi:ATP-dependent RNA helicase DDX35